MRTDWETRALGQICTIKPPKSEARVRLSPDQLVSFLPMEDLGIDRKFVCGSRAKPLSAVTGSYTYFADGDVLLAKITPCFENGKLGIANGLANGIGFGSSEYIVFRPSATLDKEWLYYFLSRESFREEGAARMAGAVGHKRVAKEFIESYRIPVPPLPEQQRIVAILDEAFAGISAVKANAERNLKNAQAIFESHLQSVFSQRGGGWVSRTLGDIAEFKNGLNFSRRSKGQTLRIVGVGDFQDLSVVPIRSLQSVTIDGAIGEDYLIREGDLLTVRSNGSKDLVGRCMLVPEVVEPTSFSGFIIRLRVDERQINGQFLLHFMKAGDTRDRLTRDGGGANINNINQAKLAALPIAVPSLQEQQTIVVRLDALRKQCDNLVALCERRLVALDALKKSLLHRAFAGELTGGKTSELIEAVA
jgi:type I restriction enzyme, S subunit